MISFTDILDEHGVTYSTSGPKTREGWVNLTCPWCGRKPYLGYSIAGRFCSCWNCGYHSVYDVVKTLTGLDGKACWELVSQLPRSQVVHSLRVCGTYNPPEGLCDLTHHHREYLRSRGFLTSQIRSLWDVRGIGMEGGFLKWRLFIPIFYMGEPVSWTTRSINPEKELRYFSAGDKDSTISVDDLVYGLDHVRQSAVIVEGPLDVWRIGPGAVATLGTAVTPSKLKQISTVSKRVVCFDNEPEAQERARRLVKDLSVFEGETFNVVLESAKDAAAADKSEIRSLRRKFLGTEEEQG